MISKIKNLILNFVFPQQCLGCGEENQILCEPCLKRIDYPTLPKCGNIFIATDYNDETAKKAIWALKYKKAKQLAKPLAELIYQRSGKHPTDKTLRNGKTDKWLIIPIPLSRKRLQERGFNQSDIIAKHLSQKMSIITENNVLYKKFHTDTQVSIKDKEKRLNNLVGSFAVKNAPMIKSKNIILIDDVTTTGATIAEASKTLRASGAKKIIAMVVAKG